MMIITLPAVSSTTDDLLREGILAQVAASSLSCVVTGLPQDTEKIINTLLNHPNLSSMRTHFLRELESLPLNCQQQLATEAEQIRFMTTSRYDLHTAIKMHYLDASLYEKLKSLVIQVTPTPSFSKHHAFTQTVLVNHAPLSERISLKQLLEEIEESYIQQALVESQGVVSAAANKLGLRRTTLIEKIKKQKKK